jgi:integrase|nr:MAG TPA: site specific tyrosine recombinase [Bacteriophage sp.]
MKNLLRGVMSLKGSNTSAEPLKWDEAIILYKSLLKDNYPRLAAMVILGIHTGLRIGDIRMLTWEQLLGDNISIVEQKTSKFKYIALTNKVIQLLHTCYIQSGSPNKKQHFLLSQKGMVYTIQRLNVIMKEWKYTYNLNVNNISTHTLRKTMATKLLSLYTDKVLGIKAVQGALNHDSVDNTLRYLGISQDTYELWVNSSKNICL